MCVCVSIDVLLVWALVSRSVLLAWCTWEVMCRVSRPACQLRRCLRRAVACFVMKSYEMWGLEAGVVRKEGPTRPAFMHVYRVPTLLDQQQERV